MVQAMGQVVVGVLVITFVYKVTSLRRGALPAQVALTGVFGALALGLTPFTGVHVAVLGNSVAVRGWGFVFGASFMVVAACLAQIYLTLLSQGWADLRGRLVARVAVAVAAVVLIVVLGVLTPWPQFGTSDLDSWAEPWSHALFLAYLAWSLGDVSVSATHWSRRCGGVLRLSLRTIVAGACLGIVYTVGKGADVVTAVTGHTLPVPLMEFFRLSALTGLLLVAAGSVMPAADRLVARVGKTSRLHRQLDALYPVWADLVAAVPGVALEPVEPRWRDRLHAHDLELRLYRRVIEIRDGLHHIESHEGDGPRLSVGVHLSAATAAAGDPSLDTFDDELAWWTKVAHVYRRPRVPAGLA